MAIRVGMIDRYGRAIYEGDVVMVDALIWDKEGIHSSGETLRAKAVYFEDGSGSSFFFDKVMKPCKGGGYESVDNDYIKEIWLYKPSELEVVEDFLGKRFEKGKEKKDGKNQSV